jgi:hypothetical protein
MRGERVSAGTYVVTVVLDGDGAQRCAVAVDAIAEVIVVG